jgi:hypothetical protein
MRCKAILFCCIAALLGGLTGANIVVAAEPSAPAATGTEQNEMPVMTGQEWQLMHQDAKLAFVWGIGHVVTIEEHVLKRHPEMQGSDFIAKLAEGLKGIPMNGIVQTVDDYYKKNPGDLDLPVMRVIWGQIVKPKLATGIGDSPLNQQHGE